MLCALAILTACAPAPVVYRDRLVEVPVAVRAPLDAALTADCVPKADVPAEGAVTVDDALDRLAAVEEALIQCRAQLGEIRKIK